MPLSLEALPAGHLSWDTPKKQALLNVRQTCDFQLRNDHVNQARHRRPTRIDIEASRLAIERITLGMQIAKLAQRIRHLQQRATLIVLEASKQLLGC